jgi:GxxExxY protein
MTENQISFDVRGIVFKVYNALGPGLLESAYEAVLMYELQKAGFSAKAQVPIPLIYEGVTLEVGYRMDILVENKVLIEIKSVETLHEVHHKQVITYLKLANLKLGLLINFNTSDLKNSIFRKVNGL